jgi:hypothetical protein
MEGSEVAMPIKPNGALCKVREQIVEDDASGLILGSFRRPSWLSKVK